MPCLTYDWAALSPCLQYYAFTRWGRVGVPGQQDVKSGSLSTAMSVFLGKFREKTKNEWSARSSFVKFPCVRPCLPVCVCARGCIP